MAARFCWWFLPAPSLRSEWRRIFPDICRIARSAPCVSISPATSRFPIFRFPSIVIRGEGLVLRFHCRADVPPLISIKRVPAEIGFWKLLRRTRHVRRITLEGLRVTMPPVEPGARNTSHPMPGKKAPRPSRVVVDEMVSARPNSPNSTFKTKWHRSAGGAVAKPPPKAPAAWPRTSPASSCWMTAS